MKLISTKKYIIQKGIQPKDTGYCCSLKTEEDDYVANSMGTFGTWQLLVLVLASITRITATWNYSSIIFLAPDTKFFCKKLGDNATVAIENNTCYESCVEYEYVRDVFEETLVIEFGLICDRGWLASFTQTVLMFGVICGVSLAGWISDRWGRSKALILSGIMSMVFTLITPFLYSYWMIAASTFFKGIGSGGYFALIPVYNSEIVGSNIMEISTCITCSVADAVALPVIAVMAYFSTSWRTLMITYSCAASCMLMLSFILPETPRWLIAKGKLNEAVDLMSKAAKFNKRDTSKIRDNVIKSIEQLRLHEVKKLNLTYFDLIRTKKMALKTFSSVSIWSITGFSFFGLMQYVPQFGVNIFIVTGILGLTQILACPIIIPMLAYCKRKPAVISMFVTTGILMLVLIFVPEASLLSVILGCLGVSTATVLFTLVYILVIELYPTPMRNMGFSVSSVGSKVGAMIAPFVVNIKTRWIASSIFAAACFAALLFCFLLPETKSRKLKDSVDDDDS